MNVRGRSCTTPAGRRPSSRSRPPGRMRIGVVESLSDYRLTSVRDRPWVIGYVARPSADGWRAALAGVGESSRRLTYGQKRKPATIAGADSLAIGMRTGGSLSPVMPSYLSLSFAGTREGTTLYHHTYYWLAALLHYAQASRSCRSECTSIPHRCKRPTRNTLSSL